MDLLSQVGQKQRYSLMAVSMTVRDRAQQGVRTLNPGYFALVMASGIISTGMWLRDYRMLSLLLLVVCAAAYIVLVVLTGARLIAYREALRDDFADPARAFGFFTFIAATDVLGTRVALDGPVLLSLVLLVVAVVTWLVLGYVIPWTAVLGRTERPVVATANGTWFIWVVASQSVAVSAATLEPEFPGLGDLLAAVAVISWSVGVLLYAASGIFVVARMLLYELRPEDLTPPYWVAMGALAITVLAGAQIVEMGNAPMVAATRSLVAGLSVPFWAFGTWLVPVLIAAGWWRHWRHRVPFGYEAALWSIIFPMGMYAVASLSLGRADALPGVGAIGVVALWVAFSAWALTLVGMARHLVRTILLPRSSQR